MTMSGGSTLVNGNLSTPNATLGACLDGLTSSVGGLSASSPGVSGGLVALTTPPGVSDATRPESGSGIPANFEIVHGGTAGVTLSGGSASSAVVYAPNAPITMSGGAAWYGAIIGSKLTDSGGSPIHYDSSLQNDFLTVGNFNPTGFTWSKNQLEAQKFLLGYISHGFQPQSTRVASCNVRAYACRRTRTSDA